MRPLRFLAKAAVALVLVLAVAVATRRFWLPQRFAVNVPLRSLVGGGEDVAPEDVALRLQLPPSFTVTRFASGLQNARFLRVTEAGDVVVSQPREGRVTLLRRDENGDGISDGTTSLISGLDRPHGLALHEGFLYVGEMTAVGRIAFDASTRATSGAFERVITGLPAGGNHWTRTIGVGPDGFLYVSVGSSCNVCIEQDSRRAAILRYDMSTWKGGVYASGLRNSVGFAWRAVDGVPPELIATDNGRDLLGDDFPPCELNRVIEGGFYGWPYANGDRVKDPDLGAGHESEIALSRAPIHAFAAHNAPLGITVLDAPATPEGYRGAALVALHGSWNRSSKDGYKVVSLHWDSAGRITQRDFLTGFLRADTAIGRPVDVAQGADGAIYVSDDYGGAVFRIAAGTRAVRSESPTQGVAAPEPAIDVAARFDPAAVARGRMLWEGNRCIQCHDPATMAGVAPKTTKKLEHLTARYDMSKMVTYLRAPQPPMPLFEMTDPERRDLAAYVLDRYR